MPKTAYSQRFKRELDPSGLFSHRGIPFKPIHAELPNFDWRHAAILQFVEENRHLINIVRDRWWGYDKKIEKRALKFVEQTQGKTVFDVTKLEKQYKKTIEQRLKKQYDEWKTAES
ncbi:MAG: hypothetical protein RID09_09695 [Coleofasciculus sp. G1-WW12-02]|uniref:hypothetical protein n=1 Tax=Coleofasciculus sp. G1-WW12-02 TaxID=3068483 RepID=UPI003303583C